MALDRLSSGYEPNFDIDAAVGRQGELFWRDVQKALEEGSAEVKTDERALTTGNIYVEYECLRHGNWQSSGISTSSAEVWVHIIGTVAICVPLWQMKQAARQSFKDGLQREMMRGSHPTRGVLIPLHELISRLADLP